MGRPKKCNEEIITIAEATNIAKIPVETIMRCVKDGAIPSRQVFNGPYLINRRDLEMFKRGYLACMQGKDEEKC